MILICSDDFKRRIRLGKRHRVDSTGVESVEKSKQNKWVLRSRAMMLVTLAEEY